jgi:ribonucleoside-diphosphate reductase alpha chain
MDSHPSASTAPIGHPLCSSPFSDTALKVLRARYFLRDNAGRPLEDASGMLARVARAVASPGRLFGDNTEFWEERFFERMQRREFLPNSPTLMNAGLPNGQLAACFVLPLEDDLNSIFTALSHAARIHQTGGGTGFSFSALRPAEDRVHSTGGIASGPISFMELFDHATAVIRQGGRRRGANMAVLRVDHPDIESFINVKRTPGRLENFNLSVGVTDAFFNALETRTPFALRNPRTGRVTCTVDPQELFDAMADAAWAVGDPGLLFLDEINRHNPTPELGCIEATNPCGEQPLLAHESCTLGSINLAAFCIDAHIDWQRLKGAIRDAVVFLDNIIEANCYPFPEIEAVTRRTRKIGLGVMGLADLLARVGIPYDSEAGITLGGTIARFLTEEARLISRELGEKRGSYPAFRSSGELPCLRNASITCIAPTGTISLIAGASSSIEPFFALAFARHLLDGQRIIEVNPLIEAELRRLDANGEDLLDAVRETGSLRLIKDLPEGIRRRFPIALEIAPQWHARMQAAFQAHIDAAVSKTVNLPPDAPVSAVHEVFNLARTLQLKGITVYRYGSRTNQTLSLIEEEARPDCRECAV